MCVITSLALLAIALGLSSQTTPNASVAENFLISSGFTLVVSSVIKHVVDYAKHSWVRWDKSWKSLIVALAPLLLGSACIAVALEFTLPVLLSLGCSIGNVYLSELLSMIASWKAQRLHRTAPEKRVVDMLNTPWRSVPIAMLGYTTIVVLSALLCARTSSPAIYGVSITGSVIWGLAAGNILAELTVWYRAQGIKAPDRFRQQLFVLGVPLLMIAPEKVTLRPSGPASRAALAPDVESTASDIRGNPLTNFFESPPPPPRHEPFQA